MHASERYARMRLHVQTRKPVHTDIRLKCRSVLQLFLVDRLEVHGTMLSMLFDLIDRAVYCSCQKQTSYTFRGYELKRDVTKFQGYTLLAV